MKTTNIMRVMALAGVVVVATLFSFALITQQQMASAAQMTLDEWCGVICDPQDDAREEVEREQTAELSSGGENAPTFDEFIAEVNEEGEFDDQ